MMSETEAIEAIEEKTSPEEKFEAIASWMNQVQQSEVLATPQKTHGLHKTQDTTSKASASSTIERNPHKPVIPLPNVKDPEHIGFVILKLQQAHEKLSAKEALLNVEQMSKDLVKLEQLHQENLQSLKEYANVKGQRHTWDVLHSLLSYFATASSFVVAAGYLATPGATVAGYLLLSAAGLGLTNQIARDHGWWDKLASYFSTHADTKQRIAKATETFMTVLTVGTALFTISWGHTHGMADVLKRIHESGGISKAVGLTSSTGQAITAVGTGLSTSKFHKAEEVLIQNQRSMTQTRFGLDEKSKQTFDAMKTQESIDHSIIDSVRVLEDSQKLD